MVILRRPPPWRSPEELHFPLVEQQRANGRCSDFLRTVVEAVLQLLMDADVEGMIGAARYERSGERTTWRNGHRDRVLDTRLGSLQLRIPKLRQGSYFPASCNCLLQL
jgi:putative transposase